VAPYKNRIGFNYFFANSPFDYAFSLSAARNFIGRHDVISYIYRNLKVAPGAGAGNVTSDS